MRTHDLVYVRTQPDNQFVQLAGEYAVVTETHAGSDYVEIATIDLAGETKGFGTVPVTCLEVVNHTAPAPWRAAHVVYKGHAGQFDQEEYDRLRELVKREAAKKHAKERREANQTVSEQRQRIKEVADKHGLKPSLVRQILEELGVAYGGK